MAGKRHAVRRDRATVMLGRSAHVQVNADLVESSTLVVTFAPRAAALDQIWGGAPFVKLGHSVLGFVDFGGVFYPSADIADHMPALRPLIAGYDRIVTYGHSFGAYAALKYGRLLGAARSVALAPFWSLDPADVGAFDPRRVRLHYRPELHAGMRVTPEDLAPDAVAVVDPHDPDSRHLDAMRAAGCDVALAPSPFTTHHALHVCLDAGTTPAFLREIADGDGPQGLRNILRRSRPRSPRYVAGALAALGRKRKTAAWSRIAERHAPAFADDRRVAAQLARGAVPDDAPIVTHDDWGMTFFFGEPAAANAAADGQPIERFLEFDHAKRWLDLKSAAGATEAIARFLDAYLATPQPVRRLSALASVIALRGKSPAHLVQAHRLVAAARAIDPESGRLRFIGITTGLAKDGRATIGPRLFASRHGSLVEGRWDIRAPAGAAEILRSLPVELPPGRFHLRIDADGDRPSLRRLAMDVVDVRNRSYLARGAGLARLLHEPLSRMRRLLNDGTTMTAMIPDFGKSSDPRVSVVARMTGASPLAFAFRGVDIVRA